MLSHAVLKGFVALYRVICAQFPCACLPKFSLHDYTNLLLFVCADACVVAGHNEDG